MLDTLIASLELIIQQTKANANILLLIFCLLLGSYLINVCLGKKLNYLGIMPRTSVGLIGIFFAPLLHANLNHLFFNLIPLLILSNFILINGLNFFLIVTVLIVLCSGFLIWCFAKPGIHIGASALTTGYWGFIVSNIWQEGSLTAIIIGLISIYYFAGIFFGIFPQGRKNISWEGHLFGLLAGILSSYLLRT